jgi:hypothetical protein
MGKRKEHYTKDELLLLGHRQRQALDAAAGSMKIITLVILHEKYGFGPKRLNDFIEHFDDVLSYYNASNDYQALLKEWNDYFADYAGIHVLPERGEKK